MHECVIGIWWGYADTECVTFNHLKKIIWIENRVSEKHTPLSDYLDEKVSIRFQRFDYCPYCGKKIDWKGLRETQGG